MAVGLAPGRAVREHAAQKLEKLLCCFSDVAWFEVGCPMIGWSQSAIHLVGMANTHFDTWDSLEAVLAVKSSLDRIS